MKYLGFDIGGTYTKYALLTVAGEIVEKAKFPTIQTNTTDFLQSLDEIVEKYQKNINGIAIAAPGIIDSDNGIMHTGGYLTYIEDLAIVEHFETKYNLPTAIENDARSASLAERWQGAIKDYSDAIVLVIGTGIGGALIINNQLYKGANLRAGELSYVTSNLQKSVGLENILGRSASFTHLVEETLTPLGYKKAEQSGELLFELVEANNDIVIQALEKYARLYANIIYNLSFFLDPAIIALGGGVSQQPRLIAAIEKEVEKTFSQLPINNSAPKIVACQFYNDANLIGALSHLLQKLV